MCVCVWELFYCQKFGKKCGKKIKLNFVCFVRQRTNKIPYWECFGGFSHSFYPKKNIVDFLVKSNVFFCPQFGKNFVAKKIWLLFFSKFTTLKKNDQPITINWKSNRNLNWKKSEIERERERERERSHRITIINNQQQKHTCDVPLYYYYIMFLCSCLYVVRRYRYRFNCVNVLCVCVCKSTIL